MRGSWWESPDVGPLAKAGFTLTEWVASHWTTHTFTINSSDQQHLINKYITSTTTVTCLHCGAGGVNTERFNPNRISEARKLELRNELNLSKTDLVVGFIGRLVARKGIVELVTAFQQVVISCPQAKLLIVGGVLKSERDKTTLETVKAIVAADQALVKSVIFTGFRDDTPDLLSLMNILVLPSRFEPFGMTMAEAAAMGCPVIATNTQGAREGIVPGYNGLIVPVGDTNALRDAILQLATDPQKLLSMGRAGRLRALECFDEQVIYEKIKVEYDRMLRQKRITSL